MAQLGTQGGINIINSGFPEIDERALERPGTLAYFLPWLPASHGVIHNTNVWTKYPVGGFRKLNEAAATTQAEMIQRTIQLGILDASQDYDTAQWTGTVDSARIKANLVRQSVYETLVATDAAFFNSILEQAQFAGGAGTEFNGTGKGDTIAGTFKVWFLALGDGYITGRLGKQENSENYFEFKEGLPYFDQNKRPRALLSIHGWMQPVLENRFALAAVQNIAATDNALREAYYSIPQAARAQINAIVAPIGFLTALADDREKRTLTGAYTDIPGQIKIGLSTLNVIENNNVQTATTTTTTTG